MFHDENIREKIFINIYVFFIKLFYKIHKLIKLIKIYSLIILII